MWGWGARLDHRPAELSGGEKQRRRGWPAPIILDPVLMLCDEPTGNLDHALGRTSWRPLLLR